MAFPQAMLQEVLVLALFRYEHASQDVRDLKRLGVFLTGAFMLISCDAAKLTQTSKQEDLFSSNICYAAEDTLIGSTCCPCVTERVLMAEIPSLQYSWGREGFAKY